MITVFVALLDEGVNVWRPVPATPISGEAYLLGGTVPDGESWQFEPGVTVSCVNHTFSDGSQGLIATAKSLAQPVAPADRLRRPLS